MAPPKIKKVTEPEVKPVEDNAQEILDPNVGEPVQENPVSENVAIETTPEGTTYPMIIAEKDDVPTKDIIQWCDKAYGDESTAQRYFNLIEEVIELGVALGLNNNEIYKYSQLAYKKSLGSFANKKEIPGEIADINICLLWLADNLGYNVQEETAKKMEKNLKLSDKQIKAKIENKKKIGLKTH